MATLTIAQPASSTPRRGHLAIAALIGGASAAAVNTAVLVVGKMAGVGFLAPIGSPDAPLQAIQATNVVTLSLVPAFGAALLLALLGRLTRHPVPIFLTIAGLFFLLSLYPDWTLPMDSLATRLLLTVMHLVAAAIITATLLRAHRS